MQKSKTLILGILSGLICAASVFFFMQNVQGEAAAIRAEALSRYGGEQLEVCVAIKDIVPGDVIDSSNVAVKLWLADLLPEEAIQSFNAIAGRRATSSIFVGEVISEGRFKDVHEGFMIPEGLSALSVPAKDVQTVGGSLKAGMNVDIYATGASTSLVARNVLVLATNAEAIESVASAPISWVTLALKPETVQEVIAVSQDMELYFVLPGNKTEGGS